MQWTVPVYPAFLLSRQANTTARSTEQLVKTFLTLGYLMFEPGDAHHAHHHPDYHGPDPEQPELGGGVAAVHLAVLAVSLSPGRVRIRRSERMLVLLNQTEIKQS